jgi:1-phosphofructokinase
MKPYVVTITLNPALDKTVTIKKLIHGGLNRVSDIRIDAGGKGINVAKVLNKFRVNVIATGLISGFQGQILSELLSDEKIEAQFVRIPGDTRTNLKIVEEETNITTEINEAGFSVRNEDLEQFKDRLSCLLENASFMVLSGSLPVGVKEDIYAELIQLAGSKGVRTVLDADGIALQKGIKATPYAVKPNLNELEKLFGRKMSDDMDIIKAGSMLQEQGVEIIAVSMGAEGAILMKREEILRVRTFPVTPISTVAAGDSMVAALVFSLLNEYPLEYTAKWITAAGTITALKSGTQVCSFEEVQKSLDLVSVEKIHLVK